MYNYNHLFYFYMTVKAGSVTTAAKKLSISQPSLSAQLKVLEEFLQKKLFIKIGRKNQLTREGTFVYGYCRQMFELSEEMHESMVEKIPHVSRRVYIGVSNEIAHTFVVEVISHFLKKYNPLLRPKVRMISGSHDKLIEQLKFREIDAIVTPYAVKTRELENLQKVEVPVNLVCLIDKKNFLKKRNLPILKILELLEANTKGRWVVPPSGFKLRSEIDNFFELNNLRGEVVFESDVIESLTRSVVDEVGISFLPLIYVPKEIENKSLYSFGPKKGFWKHRIWIACHNKSVNDELSISLGESFKDICNPFLNGEL